MIELSRSHLSTLTRCERQFYYKYVQNLGDPGSRVASEGTILHAGLAAAYRAAQLGAGPTVAGYDGATAIRELIAEGTYEYRGEEQKLLVAPDDVETTERLLDALAFYMWHRFDSSLAGAQVLAVEQTFEVELLPGVQFSGVIDLLLRRGGVVEVWDHKSVGNVNDALAFLGLDVQMLSYEVIVNEFIRTTALAYGASVELVYNLLRRERPPGFGSRSKLTKSGAKSTASTNPDDYLRQVRWAHSGSELEAVQGMLARKAVRADRALSLGDLWPDREERRPIKTGGEACRTSCGFFARCCAELLGHQGIDLTPMPVVEETD